MLTAILLVGTVIFVGYAVVTYYKSTPNDVSVLKRVWTAVTLAAAAAIAAVAAFFQSTP